MGAREWDSSQSQAKTVTSNPNHSPKFKTTHNHIFQLKFESEIRKKQGNHIQPKSKLPKQKQTD